MKKKITIALVSVLLICFLIACSGKSNNASSNSSGSTQSGRASNAYNPKDHFTAVSVDIDFVRDWMLPTDGVITEVELEDKGLGIYRIRVQGITKSQCGNYEKTLEANGLAGFIDTYSNKEIVIDFTRTYLTDKAEESVLTLRIYER